MVRYIFMYSKYKRVYKNCNNQAFENYIDRDELLNELDKQLDIDKIPSLIKEILFSNL